VKIMTVTVDMTTITITGVVETATAETTPTTKAMGTVVSMARMITQIP
jgi:hypothetical protein